MRNSIHLRTAALGALALASSSGALAFDYRTEAADFTVYWAGASASTLSGQELAINNICTSDVDLFYVPTGGGGATNNSPLNDWVVACVSNKAGLVGKVAIVKRDRGGSGVGVGPVQSGVPISFLTVNNTTCPNAITPGVDGAPTFTLATDLWGCSATYTTVAPAGIGTSDMEPDKFIGINTPVVDGSPAPFINGAAFGGIATTGALAFNTPVTLTLRNALQASQFPVSSVCNPANADYNAIVPGPALRADGPNSETEACMPSLTTQEVNSILTGRIVLWSQLLDATGTAIAGLSGATQICRRVEGSGSQATVNAIVGSWPCDLNRADNSINIVTPRNVASSTLVLNSSSGNVASCLNTFNNSATNKLAIGLLSVEGRNNDNSSGWRFIKLDGVAPTLRNIHAGDYELWAQQSIQHSTTASAATIAAFNLLATGLNSPTALRALSAPGATCATGTFSACGSLYSWGQSGWLATPSSALLYDNVLDVTRPVNVWTREVTTAAGLSGNVCQRPLKSVAGNNAPRGVIATPTPLFTP
jgi:hypothetical protein